MKISRRIIPLHFGLTALFFVLLNYSKLSWDFFNLLGGEVLAKVAPEVLGIIFFLLLAKIYISKLYPTTNIRISRKDIIAAFFLTALVFVFHLKQFYTYFWKDDFYYFLNRSGTSYSFYAWGPWLSSYSLLIWEFIRKFFGFSIFPYQFLTLLSHALLGIGVYFLSRYLSKSFCFGIIVGALVSITSVSFEAFQWLTQPLNFAWQGFFVCISLIALIWEIEKSKGRKVPYLSFFIFMAALGAGVARIGFALPLITLVIFLFTIRYLKKQNVYDWIKGFIINQWIYYSAALIFFLDRGLLFVKGTKSEVITVSLYRLYLYVIGVFSFPPEFYSYIGKFFLPTFPNGSIIVFFGFIFLLLVAAYILISTLRHKYFPVVVTIGYFWLVLSALYYTLFGPHLPASNYEIDRAVGSHHLSYLGSIGAFMIWGFLYLKVLRVLLRIKKPYGHIIATVVVVVNLALAYNILSNQYDVFLDLAKGVNEVRQKFFFDTYRKYISRDTKQINIFYDDGALKRVDNYKPNEGYYRAFWNLSKIKVIRGDEELGTHFRDLKGIDMKKSFTNNLYYIYTDYDAGLVQEDLSHVLRSSIYNTEDLIIDRRRASLYWGKKSDNGFLPEVLAGSDSNFDYFKNPVIVIDGLIFPSILTPDLNIKINVRVTNYRPFVDLRAGIFSQLLNSWTLPSDEQLRSLVKYYSEKPSESKLGLTNILSTPYVADKMVCDQQIADDGIAFLVVWFGEPDIYLKNHPPSPESPLSNYLDRYYSICSFPSFNGIKEMNLKLPNLGSILRQIIIIPLTKQPVSLEIMDGMLSTPRVMK